MSLRVSIDEKRRLLQLTAAKGQNLSAVLREGLQLVETRVDEARKAGFSEGYAKGLGKFQIGCNVCGKLVTMDSEQANIRARLNDAFSTWGHKSCHDR